MQLAQTQYGSNVVERCLEGVERAWVLEELVYRFEVPSKEAPQWMPQLLQDRYANYVIQKALRSCRDPAERHRISGVVRPYLGVLQREGELVMQKWTQLVTT